MHIQSKKAKDVLWVPAAAAWLPPAGAAGPSAACRPSALPARSAQPAAQPLQELLLERVPQAPKVPCTSA